MNDELRTAVIDFLIDEFHVSEWRIEQKVEEFEKHLNELGFYFYDENYKKPVKL